MRTRSRKSAVSRTKLVSYGAVIALSVAGLGYAAFSAYGQPRRDEIGCFSVAPQSQRIVFIDSSQPRWNEQQALAMRSYLAQVWNDLDFNERLSVYTTEKEVNHSIIKPRFEVCGQASDPQQLVDIGVPAATPGYLEKRRERLYQSTVMPQMAAILSTSPPESRRQRYESPLFEVLQDISKTLRPNAKLALYSDLIANTEIARFCQVENDLPAFKNFIKRPAYQLVKPKSYQGAEIELLIIQRTGYGQGALRYCSGEAELIRFWTDYFEYNDASGVLMTRIRQGFGE